MFLDIFLVAHQNRETNCSRWAEIGWAMEKAQAQAQAQRQHKIHGVNITNSGILLF